MDKLKFWFAAIYELVQDIAEQGNEAEQFKLRSPEIAFGDNTVLGGYFSELAELAEEQGDIAKMKVLAEKIREATDGEKPYTLLTAIINLLEAPDLFVRTKKLSRNILVVAKQGYGRYDWAAYVRCGEGENYQKDAALVMVDGDKIRHSIAKVLFPRS